MTVLTTPRFARRAILTACLAFVLSAVPVALASALLLDREREARTAETRMLSEQAALRLTDFVRARFLALEIVRRETANPAFVPDERFDSIAEATQIQYGGFQAINWIDSSGVIRRVVPREPNLPALGRSLRAHGPTRESVEDAMRSGQPRATPPIPLLQGGRGFATYFPVVRGDQLAGVINGVFRVDDLVDGCLGRALLERYVVVIDDRGRPVYGDAEALPEGATFATQVLPILDREWRLRLGRRDGAARADPALVSFVAVGLAFALALALAAFLAVRRQEARLEAEREQHRLEHHLAAAHRLEALGRMAGGIAHDFNNLLAVILGAGEIALRLGGPLRPAVKESLEDAMTAAERASGLTRQLLAFAREQPRDARRLDLSDVVRTTERMLRRLVREDVELRVRVPDEPVWVVSDAAQLTQIIVNLVVNAADALASVDSARARHIDVSVAVRDGAVPREPAGRWAVIEVRDDGPGIAPDDLERIYEPFFTTKAARGGTGLGLATVYGLLQQHGGHVHAESELGAGATFRAFFPTAVDGARADLEPHVRDGAAPLRESARVLLVEDEELLRRMTARALSAVGYGVTESPDGVDALAQLDAGLEPDVVVSDLVMPRMGGLDLLRAMRDRGHAAPAILLSGHADVEVNAAMLDALDARFVAKPYTASELASAVRAALAGET
ncbi:MAG: ATP-binding protein, partial [Myxococcota bacterium]|nr:ATP-binding protein [Myxococcota bacterium]